ncbi:hypothetical protein PV10_00720 [Exophiala mesophila]|uniref:Transcription factor domain-containing protein n=1 Tax=Exophiala mesophila TaxID=212818 RepID=A0A0D1ZQN7_EXOME|nr:uncharacterized protein PV10_00720 [Exophiala mesophila]KIV96907.1 hypothetical protein PV10_00720 [Exophiala mesophila]
MPSTLPPRPAMRRKSPEGKRSDIIFINSHSELLDAHAKRVARRHASYWGHKQSRRKQSPTVQSSSISPSAPSPSSPVLSKTTPSEHHDLTTKPLPLSKSNVIMNSAQYLPSPVSTVNLHFGASFDVFQSLPQLRNNRDESPDLQTVKSLMPAFLGDTFIRNTLLRDGESCHLRYAACLLLCHAYYLVISGRGASTALMSLKGQVMKRVNRAMDDPDQAANLDTMIAVMALGTPIVCEVTNSSTDGSQASDSRSSDSRSTASFSSPESTSSLAESTAIEYHLHYQAVTRLLRMQPDPAYLLTADGRFVFLVKVISSAHRMLTTPGHNAEGWTKLFEKFELYSSDTTPDSGWNSPLFGPSHAFSRPTMSPATHKLKRCLDLSQAARTWILHHKRRRRGMSHNLESARLTLENVLATKEPRYTTFDWDGGSLAMYESCVIAVRLMTESADRDCSLSDAVPFVAGAAQLPHLLRRTDLLQLWGDSLRGLLYWVTLICHVISVNNGQERLVSTLILAHFTQLFSASQIPLKAALDPINELVHWPMYFAG